MREFDIDWDREPNRMVEKKSALVRLVISPDFCVIAQSCAIKKLSQNIK